MAPPASGVAVRLRQQLETEQLKTRQLEEQVQLVTGQKDSLQELVDLQRAQKRQLVCSLLGAQDPVTLIATDGTRLIASRAILEKASPYFSAALSNGMQESQGQEIRLDASQKALRILCQAMYLGEEDCGSHLKDLVPSRLDTTELLELLELASQLDLGWFLRAVRRYIESDIANLDVPGAFTLLHTASLHVQAEAGRETESGWTGLQMVATKVLAGSIEDASIAPAFQDLSVEQLAEVIKLVEVKPWGDWSPCFTFKMSKSSTEVEQPRSESHEGFYLTSKASGVDNPVGAYIHADKTIDEIGFEGSIQLVDIQGREEVMPVSSRGILGYGWGYPRFISSEDLPQFMLKTEEQASKTTTEGADGAEDAQQSEVSIGNLFFRARLTQYARQIKAVFDYVLPHATAVYYRSRGSVVCRQSEVCAAIVLAMNKLHSNEYLSQLLISQVVAANFVQLVKEVYSKKAKQPTLLSLSIESLRRVITETGLNTAKDEMNVLKCIITWARTQTDFTIGSRVKITDEAHPDHGQDCTVVKRPQGKYEVSGDFSGGANLVLRKAQLSSPALQGLAELLPCVRFPYIQPIKRIAEELPEEDRELLKGLPLFEALVKEAAAIQLTDNTSPLGKRVREEAGDRVAKRRYSDPIKTLDRSEAIALVAEMTMSHM